MAANKIIFAGTTLIDLTSDTVSEETLLVGQTAHLADGSVITGTMLKDHPDEYHLAESLLDSDGNDILDSDGNSILTRTVYRKV